MEVKNTAPRTRVLVAALALGLTIGATAVVPALVGPAPNGKTTSPSGEDPTSPVPAAGLRPAVGPGNSTARAGAAPVGSAGAGTASGPTSGATTEAVAADGASELATRWKQSTTRLKYLDHCQQTANCAGFDDSQAYSYDLDVRRQQARELEDFTKIAQAWRDEHGGGDLPSEAQDVARYFLKTGNDDVKDAAIKLISLAQPSPENMQATLTAVEDSASGPLMKAFAKSSLAQACADEAYAQQCKAFIAHEMKMGGENVQKTLARYSLELMNEHTAPLFTEIERRQDPRSDKREFLRLNREEYQRLARR